MDITEHHCYAIARGEAMECAAIVDILKCMRMIDFETAKTAKDLLENVVAILSSVYVLTIDYWL